MINQPSDGGSQTGQYINHKVHTFYVQLGDLALELWINQTSSWDSIYILTTKFTNYMLNSATDLLINQPSDGGSQTGQYINHKVHAFYVQLSDLATDLFISQTSNWDSQTGKYINHKVPICYA